MGEWEKMVQAIVEEIDDCIKKRKDEALTLSTLARKLGYFEFYIPRKFKEISGMSFRDYLWQRKLYHDPERFWKFVRPIKKL